mmetsp:Transcript_28846/g.67464  ORF Transcript_28846/g.67464 Transcript_28846/m.67464 type:complete len:296 (-) Transcript_28846:61-948(-)
MGFLGIFFSNTPLTLESSVMSPTFVCRRPLVSAMRTSTSSFSAPSMASNITAAGLLALLLGAITVSARLHHSSSWASAAALNVSPAASMTVFPSFANRLAILPIDVVFPPPLTPTIIRTAGLLSSRIRSVLPPPSRISTIVSFIACLISLGLAIDPVFTLSRSSSQILTDVLTPKSRVMSASSSCCRVWSASARFQYPSSSSITLISPLKPSRPLNSLLVLSTSALAFSTIVRVNLLKKFPSSCILSPPTTSPLPPFPRSTARGRGGVCGESPREGARNAWLICTAASARRIMAW